MKKSVLLIPALIFTMSACASTPIISSSTNTSSSTISVNPDDYWFSTYTNPVTVWNGDTLFKGSVADPSVVRGDDGFFYCFATGGVMLQSEDACEWRIYMSNVIPRPTWGDSYYSGKIPAIWAPDVVKIKDKWIYYYSLSAWDGPCGIGYAIADNITGPYTDMGRLFDSGEKPGEYCIGVNNSIDPQVFIDDDEKVYMVFGSFRGLYIVQLSDDGQSCYQGVPYQNEHKVLIAGRPTTWDGAQYEGSYIFKKDGYYYYMGSTGTCCAGKGSTYNVRVARSTSIFGPYRDSDGLDIKMSSGTTTYGDIVVYSKGSNEDVKGPGHNSVLVDDAGNYWIYAHAYNSSDNFTNRHLMMDKLEWNEKGMPYVPGVCFSYNEEKDGPWIKNV